MDNHSSKTLPPNHWIVINVVLLDIVHKWNLEWPPGFQTLIIIHSEWRFDKIDGLIWYVTYHLPIGLRGETIISSSTKQWQKDVYG